MRNFTLINWEFIFYGKVESAFLSLTLKALSSELAFFQRNCIHI